MRYFFAFISIVALALCCSCGGDTSASSHQNIVTAPSIVISPSSANVGTGAVQQFAATVVGIANTEVLWSIQEGAAGGIIDATGKYTAPMTVGTYHVIAQSQANASVSATATITVFQAGGAQGVYASKGLAAYIIVLPNDMFYAIDGSVVADGSLTHVWRLISGPGQSISGNYSASLTFLGIDFAFNANLQATYVPGTSMTGSYVPMVAPFTATTLPVSQLDFNTPADLSHITGSWSGIFIEDMLSQEPNPGTIMISSTGQVNSVGPGCSYTGMVTPDINKNFFNVTITFGAAPCGQANQTISGVAVEMLLPNGATRQLLIVMKQSTFGFAALR